MTHAVIVVGAGAAAQAASEALRGVGDVLVLDETVTGSVFDDDTDTWALETQGGQGFRADVVIATEPPVYVPFAPDFPGRNAFRGASFHAAEWDPAFDPAGKHIAVVGTDSAAGHHLGRLTESAASVTVFAHPPRRVVPEVPLPTTRAKRWLRNHTRPPRSGPSAALLACPIESVTSSGIRTTDGVDHRADAIIYATGFAIPERISDRALVGAGGLTIRQAWDDGMEPYLGIAVHGFPNYFFVTGPDFSAQAGYVAECVRLMQRTASTRIEVRRSSQRVFNERAHLAPAPSQVLAQFPKAFDLSSSAPEDDQTYDGAATLTIAGTDHQVRVRLTGHLDPIDGHYHWQGTVFESLPEETLTQARAATLTVGERSAPARIIEQTPWGTHSVAGVGAPPYAGSCWPIS